MYIFDFKQTQLKGVDTGTYLGKQLQIEKCLKVGFEV